MFLNLSRRIHHEREGNPVQDVDVDEGERRLSEGEGREGGEGEGGARGSRTRWETHQEEDAVQEKGQDGKGSQSDGHRR